MWIYGTGQQYAHHTPLTRGHHDDVIAGNFLHTAVGLRVDHGEPSIGLLADLSRRRLIVQLEASLGVLLCNELAALRSRIKEDRGRACERG